VIFSAAEFARLRTSDDSEEQHWAAHDEAAEATWAEVIEDYPELRKWVAHNKTVSLVVLERLSTDSDPRCGGW
jgi:hypothetical protein